MISMVGSILLFASFVDYCLHVEFIIKMCVWSTTYMMWLNLTPFNKFKLLYIYVNCMLTHFIDFVLLRILYCLGDWMAALFLLS